MIKKFMINILDRLPYIRALKGKLQLYNENLHVPPGHYYSPICSVKELEELKNKIYSNSENKLYGIDLRRKEQFALLQKLVVFYEELPFSDESNDRQRYYYNNSWYSYSDAIFLYSMMRYFKPKRIIEIGSGFSSAVMLDTNQIFFNNNIELHFIEPYPERLKNISKSSDNIHLIDKNLQLADFEIFKMLKDNDFLVVDSSHIIKLGSDLYFLICEILPQLNSRVKIHFHDIFFPFLYPEKWIFEHKRAWNEAYFLRSFLMYNKKFKILIFNTFLEHVYNEWFKQNMPLCLKNTGGSLWLEVK